MPVNLARLRITMQTFDWKPMFVEVLKWSRPTEHPWSATVNEQEYTLTPVAQMADMYVYVCTSDSGVLPIRAIRRQIENQVKERRFEHIVIFEDGGRQEAIFQWIKRGQGAARSREFSYRRDQSGDLLLQRLSGIAFDFSDLDEQGCIDITNVTERVAKQFDVESVTKKFYDLFTRQRDAFHRFLAGIPLDDDQRWYVSVMVNRLMFIYFIQAKRFLNNDPEYLQTKLAWSKDSLGPNRFYREFLRVLFFEGFAHEKSDRTAATNRMLGDIPYLNGGLFLPHPIEEKYGDAIQIPDAAFEKLFEFFSSWRWHLSERPCVSDREIDPDVLGYIFEKYINQKQMGAYYTKEDITGYICRNTIIPVLFDKSNLSLSLLNLPKNIEAYLYPALKQVDLLPTETDREYALRQERVRKLVADARDGKIATINDAITANLNLEAMIFDLIPFLDAQPLHRLYQALIALSVLDPTCGSGAFLFAAIKILKPIYEQMLDRMALLAERRKTDGMPFREILDAEQAHPNRDYFITKSIVVHNLYGVDLMEEATEICKLRLFLRLVADLEDAIHVEPLPDIDFNIRAGNSLVGYSGTEEIGGMFKGSVAGLSPRQQRILHEVEVVQNELRHYRATQLQINPSSEVFRRARQEIREKLAGVNAALDEDLFKTGQIHREPDGGYNTQPFHWFTAFYEILSNGGFDVIVGNPPYIEYGVVKGDYKENGEDRYKIYGYKTERSGNLYAYVIERCLSISSFSGRLGFIVPVSSVSTDRYESLQALIKRHNLHYSSYDDRPSRLFDGLEHIRLTIHLINHTFDHPRFFSTRYNKWSSIQRPFLFDTLVYTSAKSSLVEGSLPKLYSQIEANIIRKLEGEGKNLSTFYSSHGTCKIFYSRKVGYFLQVLDFEPLVLDGQGNRRPPSEFKEVSFSTSDYAKIALCCLNSNLFYWFITTFSDCRHVNKREVDAFPIDLQRITGSTRKEKLISLAQTLMENLQSNSEIRKMKFKHNLLTVQCILPKYSKPIIDEIDRVLAQHYGFSNEELDFIINYDIKYRMGRDANSAEDEE